MTFALYASVAFRTTWCCVQSWNQAGRNQVLIIHSDFNKQFSHAYPQLRSLCEHTYCIHTELCHQPYACIRYSAVFLAVARLTNAMYPVFKFMSANGISCAHGIHLNPCSACPQSPAIYTVQVAKYHTNVM